MEEAQKGDYYDASTKIWIVNDDLVTLLSHDLGRIIACAEDGDVVMFLTTGVLKPRTKITIQQSITLTAFIPDWVPIEGEEIPEAPNKVKFTCPSDKSGIFSIN